MIRQAGVRLRRSVWSLNMLPSVNGPSSARMTTPSLAPSETVYVNSLSSMGGVYSVTYEYAVTPVVNCATLGGRRSVAAEPFRLGPVDSTAHAYTRAHYRLSFSEFQS